MKLPPEIEKIVPSEQESDSPPKDFRELSYRQYSVPEWTELGFDLVDYLNQTTPNWIIFSLVNKGKRDQRLATQILPDMLGDEIEAENLIKVFPELPQGALYQPEYGAWKLFKGKELESFVKHIALRKIKAVTTWERGTSNSVADYVLNDSYDNRFLELPFDTADPNLVAFKNGTFNIATGKMGKSKPENYILNSHQYALDTSGRETPITDSWFEALFGENAAFMTQYVGFLLYRSYDYSQIILILQSEGGRGKSTFLNYVRDIVGFGNYSNLSLKQLTSDSEFNSSALYQKTLNFFADIGDDFMKSTETLKSLSGFDYGQYQFKGGQLFSARNVARLLFSANKLPSFKVGDSGLQRRIRIVPVVSPVIDQEFKAQYPIEKIKEEAPAFVYKALMAFREIKKTVNGMDWGLTKSITKATEKWQADNDTVKTWLEDRLENHDVFGGDGWVNTKEVYQNYRDWVVDNGFKVMGRNTFFENLERLGLFKMKKQINGKRIWVWQLPQNYLDEYSEYFDQ